MALFSSPFEATQNSGSACGAWRFSSTLSHTYLFVVSVEFLVSFFILFCSFSPFPFALLVQQRMYPHRQRGMRLDSLNTHLTFPERLSAPLVVFVLACSFVWKATMMETAAVVPVWRTPMMRTAATLASRKCRETGNVNCSNSVVLR